MDRNELLSALRGAVESHDAAALGALVKQNHPADVAACLSGLDAPHARAFLGRLAPAARASLFGYLEPDAQAVVVKDYGRHELAELFVHMSHDERADLFNKLPEASREYALAALAQAEREDVRRLASHPEGTVGAVMTSDYATLPPGLTAREAVERLRYEAPDKETIYQAYVVDAERRLVGTVSLRDLIVAPAEARVGELMSRDVITARAEDPRSEAARLIAHYDLLALPVVNGGDRLVGIVTYDDAMDVAEAEATEDFHRTGGTTGKVLSLRDATVGLLYRRRIFWLGLLVFGNLFTGAGIAFFEDTIATYVALVFFLPLLIDSGGNAGSQAATLMVRALATGDIGLRDWGRMLTREFSVAALLGVTMAIAVSGIGVFRGGPEIAIVVSVTMVLVVIAGSVIGMSLPFLLSRFHLDPATASAPLITSIADAVGVVIYFSMAVMVLGGPDAQPVADAFAALSGTA
jgi:magnesium transporter